VTVTVPTESSADVTTGSYVPKLRLTAVIEQSAAACAVPEQTPSNRARAAVSCARRRVRT